MEYIKILELKIDALKKGNKYSKLMIESRNKEIEAAEEEIRLIKAKGK